MDRGGKDRYFSKAIGHALDILEIFNHNSEPLSLSEITGKTGLPKSSVFRILRTLEVAGYLQRDGGDRYVLSPLIAARIPNGQAHKMAQVALPFVRGLNREWRETISVACLFENHIEVVLTAPSPEKIQMTNVQGGIIPPHASSLGKSIIAYQSESCRDRLLSTYGITRITPKTITREVDIDKGYRMVRKNGYSTDMEETAMGGYCFAAPIRDGAKVIGAISISVPKIRCDSREKYINAVVSTAAAISAKLGKG
jgi:IclR family acetate operon transcriptional repressor